LKVLNLYAGLGGNRKLWGNCEVTAVEHDEKIASIYSAQNPSDKIIIGDAHQYLLDHYQNYDFVWSSPPCQSHSHMDLINSKNKARYPDMSLYQEILFLTHYFDGKWVVENVNPYYKPLVSALLLGRHLFWANFHIGKYDVPRPGNLTNFTDVDGSEQLKEWLGIHYKGNIYYGGNHNPGQVLANCVHPKLGKHVFDCAVGSDLFKAVDSFA